MKKIVPVILLALGVAAPAFAEDTTSPLAALKHYQEKVADPAAKNGAGGATEEYSRLDPNPRQAAPEARGGVHALVTEFAVKHGVEPALAHAIVKVESNYNCNAKNPRSSATGLMQTLVPTARGVGVTGNLRDCSTSLEAGMRYLRQAIDRHGPGCAGASAYNTGLHVSSRCTGYGKKVMSLASRNVAQAN